MAKRFLTILRLLNLSSDPGSASNGDVYYNSSSNKTKIYQNGSWKIVPSEVEDLSNVSFSDAPSDGQVLTYVGSTSRWENRDVSSSTPAAETETGIYFPNSPSVGQFFFNTKTKKLYFFSNAWNEISFEKIDINGGLSSTTLFDGTFDGGSSLTFFEETLYGGISSTTVFNSGLFDGGTSLASFEEDLDGGKASTLNFSSINSGVYDAGYSSELFADELDAGSSYTKSSSVVTS